MSDIEKRVIRLIAETQKIEPTSIRRESTFEELKIDSFDGLNLLFAVESEFDIRVSDDDARNLRSVHEMIEGVTRLLADKKAAGEG
jgi:acyl carrier protein